MVARSVCPMSENGRWFLRWLATNGFNTRGRSRRWNARYGEIAAWFMCSCAPSEGQGPRPPTMVRMTSADRRLRRGVASSRKSCRTVYSLYGNSANARPSRTPDFPWLGSSRCLIARLFMEPRVLRGGFRDEVWPFARLVTFLQESTFR